MPTRAVIHIQKTAPGPPRKMAVATPAMLPVPMVADSEVIKALKGVMSPASSPGIRPFHNREKPNGIFIIDKNRRPIVKNSPAPRIRISMGMPHTIPFTVPTNSVIASISRSFRQMRLRAFRNETGNDTEVRGNAPDHTAGSGSDLLPPPATNCPDTSISTVGAGG